MEPLTTTEIVFRCEKGHRHNKLFTLCDYEDNFANNGNKCASRVADCILDINAFYRINDEMSGALSKKSKRNKLAGKIVYNPAPSAVWAAEPTPITNTTSSTWVVDDPLALASNPAEAVGPVVVNPFPEVGNRVRVRGNTTNSAEFEGIEGVILEIYGVDDATSDEDVEIKFRDEATMVDYIFNLTELEVIT